MTTQAHKINEIREAVLDFDNILVAGGTLVVEQSRVVGDMVTANKNLVDVAMNRIDGKVSTFNSIQMDTGDFAIPGPEGEWLVRTSMLDAEVLVFQNLDHAHPSVVYLVFEMTDKGTIKGVKLPKLRRVVGMVHAESDTRGTGIREHFQVEIKA